MVSSLSFAAEAVNNPTRYYQRPRQVIQDRRLNRDEKLAILDAWELEARSLSVALFASCFFLGQAVGVGLGAPVFDYIGGAPLFLVAGAVLAAVGFAFRLALRGK